MLAQLPVYLTWCSRIALDARARAVFVQWAAARYAEWLSDYRVLDPVTAGRIAIGFDALSDRAKLRLVTSPEATRQLMSPSRSTPQFFQDSIAAEQALLGSEAPDAPVWTALGDALASRGGASGAGTRLQSHAPRLLGRIVVDTASPYALRPCASNAPERALYESDTVQSLVHEVECATEIVGEVSPEAQRLLVTTTSVVILARDSSGRFGSSSWPTYIGKMGLINVHSSEVDPSLIVNGLVHESIHQLLYMIELDEPLYLNDAPKREATLVSPWTGNRIHLASFVHACFVWYGLWCFWRLAVERSRRIVNAQALAARASQGFAGEAPIQLLAQWREYVSPAVLDAVDRMGRAVRVAG